MEIITVAVLLCTNMIRSRLDLKNYTRCNGGALFVNSLRKTFKVQYAIRSRFDKLRDCKVPVLNKKSDSAENTEVAGKITNGQSTINKACGSNWQAAKGAGFCAGKMSVQELIAAPEKFFCLSNFSMQCPSAGSQFKSMQEDQEEFFFRDL